MSRKRIPMKKLLPPTRSKLPKTAHKTSDSDSDPEFTAEELKSLLSASKLSKTKAPWAAVNAGSSDDSENADEHESYQESGPPKKKVRFDVKCDSDEEDDDDDDDEEDDDDDDEEEDDDDDDYDEEEDDDDDDVDFAPVARKGVPLKSGGSKEVSDENESKSKDSVLDKVKVKKPVNQKQQHQEKKTEKRDTQLKQASGQEHPIQRSYQQETPAVVDPTIRQAIEGQLRERMLCTAKLVHIPGKCTAAYLHELAPEMITCRIPWNPITHRARDVAFLEFGSPEAAQMCIQKLNNRPIERHTMQASAWQHPINADDYNCRRLVLDNLHWRTTKQDLLPIFPEAVSIDFLPLRGSRMNDKKMPGIAFVTLTSERDALLAQSSKQGVEVRGRRIAVNFQRKLATTENKDNKTLVVFGIRKGATETEIRSIFPQAFKIHSGDAGGRVVLEYTEVEDCAVDKRNAQNAILHKRPLKVFFGRQGQHPQEKHQSGSGETLYRVFIRNLDPQTTETELRSIFTDAKAVWLPKGKIGFAIACFVSEAAAQQAVASRHGQIHRNRRMKVIYKGADDTTKPILSIVPNRKRSQGKPQQQKQQQQQMSGNMKPGGKRPFVQGGKNVGSTQPKQARMDQSGAVTGGDSIPFKRGKFNKNKRLAFGDHSKPTVDGRRGVVKEQERGSFKQGTPKKHQMPRKPRPVPMETD